DRPIREIQPEQLVELVSSDISTEHDVFPGARFVDASRHWLLEEGQLRPVSARGLHTVKLNRVAKAGGDEDFPAGGVPVREEGAPRLGVTPHVAGESSR